MKILKYTKKLQNLLGCDVDAEPWLHVAIKVKPAKKGNDKQFIDYAVYIWDTRRVMYSGSKLLRKQVANSITGQNAVDNHKLLDGSSEPVKNINADMTMLQSLDK